MTEQIPDRDEVRAWLARRLVDAYDRGSSGEVNYLLDRYILVDELVTSMELLRSVREDLM